MNEDMVEAIFDWISEMRAGNLGFIIEVPNISLPRLEAWSHNIKAWSEKITFEIEAPASIRGNTVLAARKYGTCLEEIRYLPRFLLSNQTVHPVQIQWGSRGTPPPPGYFSMQLV